MENNEVMIKVENLSMRFNIGKEKIDNFKEYIIKLIKKELFYKEFWALRDINFEVKKGEFIGIVGLNGAGKSTLLKLIAGVLKPTKGKVQTRGKIAPLIELGAGIDASLTGRENIFLNGALLGYSKKLITEKFDEIVEFSELEQFLDVPVKNYSSGMIARLGFSVATIIKPDILIVDEILSVGDFKFQQKCYKKINKMIESGTTVLFVSHSSGQIEKLCDKVLWLDKGCVKGYGDTKEILNRYYERT